MKYICINSLHQIFSLSAIYVDMDGYGFSHGCGTSNEFLTFFSFCKAATENKGPDVILENLANVNLENDLKIVADHGRIGVNIQ